MPSTGRRAGFVGAIAALAVAALAGCAGSGATAGPGQVKIVATTTQIADFARAVGGDRAKVVQLLQPNTDPHEYEPRPSDVRATTGAGRAENGDSLDRWMKDIVKQAGGDPTVLDLGTRVPVKLTGEESGPEASRYDPHWCTTHRTRRLRSPPSATPSPTPTRAPGHVHPQRQPLPREAARTRSRDRRLHAARRARPSASSSPTTTRSTTSPIATASTSSAPSSHRRPPRPSHRPATSRTSPGPSAANT